jgi:hypothetical protein
MGPALEHLKRWQWWYLCYYGGALAAFFALSALHWSLWFMIPIGLACGSAGHIFIPKQRRETRQ